MIYQYTFYNWEIHKACIRVLIKKYPGSASPPPSLCGDQYSDGLLCNKYVEQTLGCHTTHGVATIDYPTLFTTLSIQHRYNILSYELRQTTSWNYLLILLTARLLLRRVKWKPSLMMTSILNKCIIILLFEQNMNIEHTIPSLYKCERTNGSYILCYGIVFLVLCL